MVAGLSEIADDEPDSTVLRPGQVPADWPLSRRVGVARIGGQYAEIGNSRTLAWLREVMAARLVHYSLEDLDASTIRLSAPRQLTQEMSRKVFELSHESRRQFAGIAYRSRLGDELENWAIFEPAVVEVVNSAEFGPDDPDLVEALAILGLELAP